MTRPADALPERDFAEPAAWAAKLEAGAKRFRKR
jgi:hypothetical protein